MNQLGWTQAEYARRTGSIAQATLSRYISDIDAPKPSTLESLCKPLPPRIREEVVAAYLLDQIPPSASELITVKGVSQEGESPSLYEPNWPLPGTHNDKVIRTLARAMMTN